MDACRAHTVGGPSLEPALIIPSRPYSPIGKPDNGPQGKRRTHAAAGSIARGDVLRRLVRVTAVVVPFMCEVAGSAFAQSSGRAQTVILSDPVDRFAKFIEEASAQLRCPGALDPCGDTS